MEEQAIEEADVAAGSNAARPVAWRDLREWLALIEAHGLLKRINKPVDADEELAAIAYLATRRENAPALLFETIAGDRSGSRVLANMLGSSKERYALAVGLDPDLSIAELIVESRTIMNRKIAPVRIPKSKAPVNEVVLTGDDIDLTAFPPPTFWPGCARRRRVARSAARRVDLLVRRRALAAGGERGQRGSSPEVADPHRRAYGEISVLRNRRLLRHHALRAHPRRSGADRRAGRHRRL